MPGHPTLEASPPYTPTSTPYPYPTPAFYPPRRTKPSRRTPPATCPSGRRPRAASPNILPHPRGRQRDKPVPPHAVVAEPPLLDHQVCCRRIAARSRARRPNPQSRRQIFRAVAIAPSFPKSEVSQRPGALSFSYHTTTALHSTSRLSTVRLGSREAVVNNSPNDTAALCDCFAASSTCATVPTAPGCSTAPVRHTHATNLSTAQHFVWWTVR